MIIWWLFFRAV